MLLIRLEADRARRIARMIAYFNYLEDKEYTEINESRSGMIHAITVNQGIDYSVDVIIAVSCSTLVLNPNEKSIIGSLSDISKCTIAIFVNGENVEMRIINEEDIDRLEILTDEEKKKIKKLINKSRQLYRL